MTTRNVTPDFLTGMQDTVFCFMNGSQTGETYKKLKFSVRQGFYDRPDPSAAKTAGVLSAPIEVGREHTWNNYGSSWNRRNEFELCKIQTAIVVEDYFF